MLKKCLGFIFLLALLSTPILYYAFHPIHASSLTINGQTITISRDDFNIPTVHAPSFSSMMYAWGYVVAQDRLFQIAFRRLLGQGRVAQVTGEKAINIDKMFRELNLQGWGLQTEEKFKRENITEYENFKFFAKGINDFVAQMPAYPIQFYILGIKWEEWTVADIMTGYKLVKLSQAQNAPEQYIRSSLLKNYTKEEVDQILPYEGKHYLKGQHATQQTIAKDHEFQNVNIDVNEEPWKPEIVDEMMKVGLLDYLDMGERGSNSWVIGGKHTQSGHPLLVNDPHLDSVLPGQWYQIRLHYKKGGKDYKIIGGSFAGITMFIGKTSYVSVAVTTIHSDSQDLYKETINQNQEYLLDGVWRKMKKRTQVIKVKGMQDIHYPVYQTHRGPIVKFLAHVGVLYSVSQNLSLCWGGFTDKQYYSLASYTHLAEISSHQQLMDTLEDVSDYAPTLNFLYITADDHFGYQTSGPHPIRSHPHHGMYIKDGSTSKYDWKGVLKGKEKLAVHDPERGYIVTANNQPSSTKFQNGLFDVSILTARADRLQRMVRDQLQEGRKFTKKDMKRMQNDTVDNYCLEVVKVMKKRVQENQHIYLPLFRHLIDFDCDFRGDSTTATIYLVFLRQIYSQIYPSPNKQYNLAISHSFNQYLYKYIMEASTTEQITVLQRSIQNTLKILQNYFGTSDHSKYIYGQFHKDQMVHRPFSQSPLKVIFERESPGWGNMNTPNVAKMNKLHNNDYRTYHKANIRIIQSYFEESEWIVDGGISEKFFSKHYTDQLPLFLNLEYLPMETPISKKNEEL